MSTIISKADVARLGLQNLAALDLKESEIMLKQQVIIDGCMSGTVIDNDPTSDGILVDVGFGFTYWVTRDRIALVA